jgi:hypothetical protein
VIAAVPAEKARAAVRPHQKRKARKPHLISIKKNIFLLIITQISEKCDNII